MMTRRAGRLWIAGWALVALALAPRGIPAAPAPLRIASTNLQNAFRLTPHLYSGAAPEGEAAFAELARLGIRTLISVDGIKPDLEEARRHGLRYVHLPIGYGGVPSNRVVELARAKELVPSPVYLHCHHGMHRGPTAAALLCEASEGWSPEEGVAWMRQAGTSPDYPGLYRSVSEFSRPKPSELAQVTRLPEVSPTPPRVQVMVAMEAEVARLKAFQKDGWRAKTGTLPPRDLSNLLREELRELGRLPEVEQQGKDYSLRLAQAEAAAEELWRGFNETVPPPPARSHDGALKGVTEACTACHSRHRD